MRYGGFMGDARYFRYLGAFALVDAERPPAGIRGAFVERGLYPAAWRVWPRSASVRKRTSRHCRIVFPAGIGGGSVILVPQVAVDTTTAGRDSTSLSRTLAAFPAVAEQVMPAAS